jgi:hypothetical protein
MNIDNFIYKYGKTLLSLTLKYPRVTLVMGQLE